MHDVVLDSFDLLEKVKLAYQNGQWDYAERLAETLLIQHPNHSDALYYSAYIAYKKQEIQKAMLLLSETLRRFPKHADSFHLQGKIYADLGDISKAIHAFRQAIECAPAHFIHNRDLIELYLSIEDFARARFYGRRLLENNPKNPLFNFEMGLVYYFENKLTEAFTHFLRVTHLDKQHQEARFFCHGLQQINEEKMPLSLIKKISNIVAIGYEKQFKNFYGQICSKTIALLHNYFSRVDYFHRAVDLGCGTGWMGELLRTHYHIEQLEGVDISKRMLLQAHNKKCYHQMHHQDISLFLGTSTHPYDLIIASNVLFYYGSLEKIFRQIYTRLHSRGVFCFSVETFSSDLKDYQLSSSLRFQHTEAYLRDLARDIGFVVLPCDTFHGLVKQESVTHKIWMFGK